MRTALLPAVSAFLLSACQPGGDAAVPGESSDRAPFSGIADDERIRFTGTEPFWGGETVGGTLVYRTPDNPEGSTLAVTRFAGRGGLSLSGDLDAKGFDMTITLGECSDGMSDRTYPFTATLRIGSETRQGCAWTESRGFTGPQRP